MTIAARLRRHRLIGRGFARPEDVVATLAAVQAQDFAGAKWAIGLRCRTTEARIDALFDAGELLRTHVLRPTWHLVRPVDLRWMLALSRARVHRAAGYQHRLHGLDARAFTRAETKLAKHLAGGAMTREEIGALLGARGVPLLHLLMHAELEAVIVSGPRRGKQHTYMLIDERVPPARSPADPARELARRYLAGHAPATVADFAWWSGLDAKTARAVFDEPPAARATRVPSPVVHLLPNFDEYRIGYLRGASTDRMFPHDLLLDGEVVGGWRRIARDGGGVTITIKSPRRLDPAALARAVDRYRGFLESPVEVT